MHFDITVNSTLDKSKHLILHYHYKLMIKFMLYIYIRTDLNPNKYKITEI